MEISSGRNEATTYRAVALALRALARRAASATVRV